MNRFTQARLTGEPISVGLVNLDPIKRTVTVGTCEPIRLTAMQCAVFKVLMVRPGQCVSADRILTITHGDDAYDRSEKLVSLFIFKIRSTLRQAGAPELIHTVRNTGWYFAKPETCVIRNFTPDNWAALRLLAEQAGRADLVGDP